jgi:arabinose-5-phosphate isomerase
MDYIKLAREVLDVEIEGLRKVRDDLGADFEGAVGAILVCLEAGGKIVVTGLGKSLHVGQKIAATLTSTGSTAVVLHPSEALHGDLGILNAHDVVIAISYSGASDELVNLIPMIKRHGLPIIALTGDPSSPLAENSDYMISIRVEREACPLNISPTTSTTATLAIGDALAMVILQARGFSREDYAKLHPGGAIGRSLLLKIKDIMRTGKRVARVEPSVRVSDAVFAMTEARSGSVVVLDEDYRVIGIFTDGDLRRGLTERERLLDRRIDEVMTPQPVTLSEDQLAVDLIAYFREHQIDDLIVVDKNGRFAGMVDIQDLPRFKLI